MVRIASGQPPGGAPGSPHLLRQGTSGRVRRIAPSGARRRLLQLMSLADINAGPALAARPAGADWRSGTTSTSAIQLTTRRSATSKSWRRLRVSQCHRHRSLRREHRVGCCLQVPLGCSSRPLLRRSHLLGAGGGEVLGRLAALAPRIADCLSPRSIPSSGVMSKDPELCCRCEAAEPPV